jgi:Transcription factor WhiB
VTAARAIRPPASDDVITKAARMRCDRAGYAFIAEQLGLNGRKAAQAAVVRAVNHGFVKKSDLPPPSTGAGGRGAGRGASRKTEYVVPRTVRRDWQEDAACRNNPTAMVPRGGDHWASKVDRGRVNTAKSICAGCSVRLECELATPADDVTSIRYGTTPAERTAARADQSEAAA